MIDPNTVRLLSNLSLTMFRKISLEYIMVQYPQKLTITHLLSIHQMLFLMKWMKDRFVN